MKTDDSTDPSFVLTTKDCQRFEVRLRLTAVHECDGEEKFSAVGFLSDREVEKNRTHVYCAINSLTIDCKI